MEHDSRSPFFSIGRPLACGFLQVPAETLPRPMALPSSQKDSALQNDDVTS
jgi:hypothetical protein